MISQNAVLRLKMPFLNRYSLRATVKIVKLIENILVSPIEAFDEIFRPPFLSEGFPVSPRVNPTSRLDRPGPAKGIHGIPFGIFLSP